ncbi:hypothetical protein [Streptomyces sp. MJP52]|uniref:hypothetical protein n=1 Tax=Streptomyces sp. MJP52 TaxID=2940555 RepID=UPI0024758567|nr:hypothetical protein [Streptomyces sp. MJP52]MDH6226309.1 hypothetical protein [Streptomyces sp. MJP52]
MNETPTPAEEPQRAADAVAGAVVPAAPAGRPGRGRRAARIAGAVVLAAAVLGGTGFTAVTVRDADRDPGKPVWEHPETSAADEGERQARDEGLRAMLLTYEETGLERGPDLGEYGSDAEFDGKEAADLAKESIKELPRTQRRQLEREIDRQRIKGQAMRSYANVTGTGDDYLVEVVLTQQEDAEAVAKGVKAQRKAFDALERIGFLRSGPKVEGYEKNAWCYLPELDRDDEIDGMYCVASQGEVSVMLTADAAEPIDKKDIAGLLVKQLDRIETPGEAV